MSSDYQEYPDVVQEVRGALNPGRLKLQSNSVVFKNMKTGKVDQLEGTDVDRVQWLKRARGYCLKIMLHNGHIHRFDGFKESDQEKLSTFVQKNYSAKLEKVDMAVKGWNWGQANFIGNGLNFVVDNNLAFEVPLNNVSHTTASKSEVTLEFHQNDDAAVSLMELRFHIPPDNNNPDTDTVQDFYQQVKDNAGIIQATGDAVCVFQEVQCLTPRGRYDIKVYTTFLQLHGKTFDYIVPYTSVLRLFLLPHKDGRQIFFVVSLDPPIKQGQTRYHFLILLFYKDDEMTLECGLGDELEERYEGKLQKEMHGPEYEIVSRVFKNVTTRKITVPGSFLGHSGTPAISCSYKAATGLLYPLERGFIFVHKPPVHIRFDELTAVNFARSAGSTRSFDFDVETKAGNIYTFSSIEKDEYGKLFEFAKNKNLRMKNIGDKKSGRDNEYDQMMDSDNDDNKHDAYLERMKAEGKDRDSDAMDDDSDSSDEDFNPGDEGSDVAEEYDSNPPTTDESDEDFSGGSSGGEGGTASDAERRAEKRAEREKRKQEKKEKKQKERTPKAPRESKPRKTSKKSKKDPNAPKRPQSAYFIWFNENRENIKTELKETNPSFTIVDISKRAGELWKTVTAEDKVEFDEKAKEAKEVYKQQMVEYNKKLAEEGGPSPQPSSRSPKKKKSSSPKKPTTETKAGSGGSYKSKEFISDSESSEDEDDKPLKKLKKVKKEVMKIKKEKEEAMEQSGSEESEEEEKPTGVKRRSQRKEGEESDVGSLPDEEEILSSPEHSDPGAASASGGDDSSGPDSDEEEAAQ